MHPNHEHAIASVEDPERRRRRLGDRAARAACRSWCCAVTRRSARSRAGIAPRVAPDLALLPGVEIETGLGFWQVIETPGHAPSHVCLYQPERRILISGDHLLGRISLYFDSAGPRTPSASSCARSTRSRRSTPRLCLAGHARPFTDVGGAHRGQPRAGRSSASPRRRSAIEGTPLTAYEVVPYVHGRDRSPPPDGCWRRRSATCATSRRSAPPGASPATPSAGSSQGPPPRSRRISGCVPDAKERAAARGCGSRRHDGATTPTHPPKAATTHELHRREQHPGLRPATGRAAGQRQHVLRAHLDDEQHHLPGRARLPRAAQSA